MPLEGRGACWLISGVGMQAATKVRLRPQEPGCATALTFRNGAFLLYRAFFGPREAPLADKWAVQKWEI
jgi:hypothetical protein